MQNIPLLAVPNQSQFVRLGNRRFAFAVKAVSGCMVFDLEIDGLPVLSGSRILAGEPLIPYAYLEEGNFVLLTSNDELPDWREFQKTQQLIYLSADELEQA